MKSILFHIKYGIPGNVRVVLFWRISRTQGTIANIKIAKKLVVWAFAEI